MTGTGLVGILDNLGGGELVVILLVALVFLGPDRLPEMARGAGRMLHKVKTMTEGIQGEVRQVMDDPSMKPLRELGEIAARPRAKLTEYALEAEAEARATRERELQDASNAENTELAGDTAVASEATASSDGAADDESTSTDRSGAPTRDGAATVGSDAAAAAAANSASPTAIDSATRKEAAAKLARLTMNTEAARRASSAAASAVAEITADPNGSGSSEDHTDGATPVDPEHDEHGSI